MRRSLVGVVAIALLSAGVLAIGTPGAGAASCPPLASSGQWLGTWAIDNVPGSGGTVQSSYTLNGNAVTGSLVFSTGQSVLANGTAITGTWNQSACKITTNAGGVVDSEATLSPNGIELVGTWRYGTITGTIRTGLVTEGVSVNDVTATTDDGGGVSILDPLATEVVSPTSGPISIAEAVSTGGKIAGYSIVSNVVRITAPTATADAPLALTFLLDRSAIGIADPSSIVVFRNGVAVNPCPTATLPLVEDPCVSAVEDLVAPQDGVRITVLTSQASVWVFGAPPGTIGFRVLTQALPAATVGQPYSATLSAGGTSLGVRWKKLAKLPRGLRLNAKTGIITGTPRAAGTVSFGVQVREVAKKSIRQTATTQLSIAVT